MKATGPTAPLIVFVGAMITLTALFDLFNPKSIDHEQRFFITLAVSAVAAFVIDVLTEFPEDDP